MGGDHRACGADDAPARAAAPQRQLTRDHGAGIKAGQRQRSVDREQAQEIGIDFPHGGARRKRKDVDHPEKHRERSANAISFDATRQKPGGNQRAADREG